MVKGLRALAVLYHPPDRSLNPSTDIARCNSSSKGGKDLEDPRGSLASNLAKEMLVPGSAGDSTSKEHVESER